MFYCGPAQLTTDRCSSAGGARCVAIKTPFLTKIKNSLLICNFLLKEGIRQCVLVLKTQWKHNFEILRPRMASRLSLVSRKVKVIQGSPGSESGAKLFLMSPLIIWKQSHVQAWPTKGVFSEVHFQYYGEKNSITRKQKFSLREGFALEKSFNILFMWSNKAKYRRYSFIFAHGFW